VLQLPHSTTETSMRALLERTVKSRFHTLLIAKSRVKFAPILAN